MNRKAFDPRLKEVLGKFAAKQDLSDLSSKKTKTKHALYKAGIIADPDKPLFLYVGRFGKEKGTDLLGLISSEVTKLGGQIVIMGPGNTPDLREPLELQKKGYAVKVYTDVAKNQLEKLKGTSVKKGNAIRFAADYTVIPSYSEACGLVGLEALSMGSFLATSNAQGLKSVCLPFDDDDNYAGENCVQFDITTGAKEAHLTSMIEECFRRENTLSRDEKELIQKWLINNAGSFDWNYSHEKTGSMDRYNTIYQHLLGEKDSEMSPKYSAFSEETIQYFGENYPNLQFSIKSLLMEHTGTMEYKKALLSLQNAIAKEQESCESSILSYFRACDKSDLERNFEEITINRLKEAESNRS